MWPRLARVCDYQDGAGVGGIVAVVLSEPSAMPVTLKKGVRSGKVVATTNILIGDPVGRRVALKWRRASADRKAASLSGVASASRPSTPCC